ncbi:MAG TPA: hypothetical protein VGC80_16925, partial [Acetobacteraceae bacterium]
DADLICQPLDAPSYDFTASGTVSDAVAALRPVLAFRNRSFDAITSRYGPIGYFAESPEDMRHFLQALDPGRFAAMRETWVASLRRMREARHPEVLAARYQELVAESGGEVDCRARPARRSPIFSQKGATFR